MTTPQLHIPDPVAADLARMARLGQNPEQVRRQVRALRGCVNPVRLEGERFEVARGTGEVLHHLRSHDLPAGCLLMPCGNRRSTRCPACSEVYRRDTYQVVSAGLAGGKGVPDHVAEHPRVFLTLTAPSFGPVHNRPGNRPCACRRRHDPDDPALGTPINPDRYDYAAAVLWNNHAPKLWARFTTFLRRELAAAYGMTEKEFRDHATVAFAKVAEYQKRGAVHFHAVIRVDGATAHAAPPPWITPADLRDAIRRAHERTELPGPAEDFPAPLAWGEQIDIRPIRRGRLNHGALTDRAVAAYIAKYATKGAEATTGTLDRRLRFLSDLAKHELTDHARRLVTTAWNLGARPDLAGLQLRRWAHMLGFRGHFSTKSRAYSTTLGALRAARAAFRAELAREKAAQHTGHPPHDPDTVLVVGDWQFLATGLTPGESWLATPDEASPPTAPPIREQ